HRGIEAARAHLETGVLRRRLGRLGGASVVIQDQMQRPLGSLRLSVTDRCNLRCGYCMPEADYVWLPRSSILSYEEFNRLAGIFTSLGADKVRLTGGEPLLRHDLEVLVQMLAGQ